MEEIILCARCKGSGLIHERRLVDYHRGEYEEWEEICPKCDGSGRLLKITEVMYEKITPGTL